MTRNEAMRQVQLADFGVVDLSLYLDTHPDCPYGLAEFRKQLEASQQARAQYVAAYGPLTVRDQGCDSWRWSEMPLPWQLCE